MVKCRKNLHIHLKSYIFSTPLQSRSSGTCATICLNALLQNSLREQCKKKKFKTKAGSAGVDARKKPWVTSLLFGSEGFSL